MDCSFIVSRIRRASKSITLSPVIKFQWKHFNRANECSLHGKPGAALEICYELLSQPDLDPMLRALPSITVALRPNLHAYSKKMEYLNIAKTVLNDMRQPPVNPDALNDIKFLSKSVRDAEIEVKGQLAKQALLLVDPPSDKAGVLQSLPGTKPNNTMDLEVDGYVWIDELQVEDEENGDEDSAVRIYRTRATDTSSNVSYAHRPKGLFGQNPLSPSPTPSVPSLSYKSTLPSIVISQDDFDPLDDDFSGLHDQGATGGSSQKSTQKP